MGLFVWLITRTMPSSSFVGLPVTEEQIDSLASYFDGIEGAPKISTEGRIGEVLLELAKSADLLFSLSEKDVRAFFGEFNALFQKMRSGDDYEAPIVETLLSNITKDTSSGAALRIQLLNRLYNLFNAKSRYRCQIFLAILQFALASDNTGVVVSVSDRLDEITRQWEVNVEKKREISKLMCEITKKNSPQSKQALAAAVRYLRSFENTSDDVSAAQDIAKDALVLSLRLEDMYEDILELRAVEQLKDDKTYQLVKLFAEENIDSYETFKKSNSDIFATVGLSEEECTHKIKLLTLTSLACEKKNLSYNDIQQALHIEADQVEEWIIQAISAGLIDAKLNQIDETITVRTSKHRTFKDSQWKQLQTALTKWKANVNALSESLKSDGYPVQAEVYQVSEEEQALQKRRNQFKSKIKRRLVSKL